ncbi:MAG TPA: cytochrome c [Planctomycetota bacterium]|nr:cytochrome c [Planctomycetota bacterium]
MSETGPAKKMLPTWTFALLLLPVVALLGYTFFFSQGKSNDFVFDPANVAELQIKGAQSDTASSWSELSVPPEPASDAKLLARGKELYTKACAACHGDDGKGEGPLVVKLDLNPRPANFTLPVRFIKLRSTEAGTLPLDEDLFRSVTRGLPGTAMLSFRALSDDERWALVEYVKQFWSGDKRWPAPKPLAIPKQIPESPELLEFGRKEFTTYCRNCHGDDGTGEAAQAFPFHRQYPAIRMTHSGGKFLARGSSEKDLALTLLAGSSGSSPMMSFITTFYENLPRETGDKRLWGTVYYTRKLIEAQKGK